MPPNNHAARLREMGKYKLALSNGKLPPPRRAALKARTIHELHADDAAALLAGAEALEAWEWVMERKVTIQLNNGSWLCSSMSGYGVADTPLGAVLAAMGEDKDGSDE